MDPGQLIHEEEERQGRLPRTGGEGRTVAVINR